VSTMAYMGLVTSSWTVLPLIIPVYLLRCTANNSVYALQASITMDYVPKSARGKWNRCRTVRRIYIRHVLRPGVTGVLSGLCRHSGILLPDAPLCSPN